MSPAHDPGAPSTRETHPVPVRELWHRLGLVVGSTILTLLLAEVGLRMVESFSTLSAEEVAARLEASGEPGPEVNLGRRSLRGLVRASDEADIVYELVPGLRGTFLGRPFAINSRGLRDDETSLAKPEGMLRIVGLGDSVMFGWGVGQDESYLALVEAALAERRMPGTPRVEVLNFAVPGYNTAMEVATFEHKALAYDPDLVVIHFVANDLDLPRFLLRPKTVWTLDRSFLVDRVRTALGRGDPEASRLLGSRMGPLSEEERARVRDQYRHLVGEAGFRNAMARLAGLAHGRGIPVVFLALTDEGEPWSSAFETAAEHGFATLLLHTYQDTYLRQQGIAPSEQAWIDTFWRSESDPHPNALTHRLIARALLDQLVEQGVIPARKSR